MAMTEGFREQQREEMKRIGNDGTRQERNRTPHDGGLERPSAALPD